MKKRYLWIIAAAILMASLVAPAYAQTHEGVVLSAGDLQLRFVDEAVAIADYIDDTAEPHGWTLNPALTWQGAVVGSAVAPAVHFTHAGQEHHFTPLHQSILQQPSDAVVISAGWVVAPTSYAAAVVDADDLVTLGNLVTVVAPDTIVQTFTITATAALDDVRLMVYVATDMNAPAYDYGAVTAHGIRAQDTQAALQMDIEGDSPDAIEVGSWNDGPAAGDDVWQQVLTGTLGSVISATQYVEGALAFDLGDFAMGQAKSEVVTLTIATNAAPVAAFSVMPTEGYTDTIFTCDASTSSDDRDAVELLVARWDFEDDGEYDTAFSTVKLITHTYTTVGAKTIRLEVRDTSGLTDSITHTVEVAGAPLETATPTATATATSTPIATATETSVAETATPTATETSTDETATPTATSTATPSATPYRLYLPLMMKQFS